MKRSKICCIVISMIIVAVIQMAIKGVVNYFRGGIIISSLVYFSGIFLTTTAIQEIIHKRNIRLCLITAATGISMTISLMAFILSLFSTLSDGYKIIVLGVFYISFVVFVFFCGLLYKEEMNQKAK